MLLHLSTEQLLLDNEIRNWVLLPILIVLFPLGLIRRYADDALKVVVADTQSEIICRQRLRFSSRLRKNYHYINPRSFGMIRDHLLTNDRNGLTQKASKRLAKRHTKEDEHSPFDSNALTSSVVQFVSSIIPNIAQMYWVSYFFSGFVALQLPFSLPSNFKVMVQKGIALELLDVAYSSSLSWYFLIIAGIGGLTTLFTGNDGDLMNLEEQAIGFNSKKGAFGQMMSGEVDFGSQFAKERNEYDYLQ